MFSKLLAAVFNRWVALTLLLLAFLAVVWIVGPLVAIASWRPLESVLARSLLVALVLLLCLGAVAWRRIRARRGNARVVDQLAAPPPVAESPDLAAVRERFTQALATLKHARFDAAGEDGSGWFARLRKRLNGRYLYQLPWYLIIGAPGAGKTTALLNAGLNFPLAATTGQHALRGVGGTRLCDWWFTDRAVLIDTAGRFTTQDSDPNADRSTWAEFLSLLKKSRPRQPLNGLLVTVSVADLIGHSALEREQHAGAVRQRLQELHEQLRVRMPIYLLVSKCDLLAGFVDYFSAIDRDQRATPWGFTFPGSPPGQTTAEWAGRIEPAFDALLQRLDEGLIDGLQAEPDRLRRARIYGFPSQFAHLRGVLLDFVRQVFAPSPFEPSPMLRGVYFISGTQEGTPIDRVLGAAARRFRIEQSLVPAQQGSGRSYFLQRLLTEVVFAEQGLAGSDRRLDRRRRAMAHGAYGAIGLLGIGLLAAWTLSWRNNASYVDTVAQRVQAVRAQVQATPNRADTDLLPLLPALQATRGLAEAGRDEDASADQGVPWGMGFGLYQGDKLDGAARDSYQRMLRDAMLPRLALRIEQQLRSGEAAVSQYEALKAYLMLYDANHYDADALKSHILADWESTLARDLNPVQYQALQSHLAALLDHGAVASPLAQDKGLVQAVRTRLAAVPLHQRVYDRLRQRGLGAEFPEVTIASAAGSNAQNVFVRASGLPLTSHGVPGLFTYEGYHQGFQSKVDDAVRTLAEEQEWVLGISPGSGSAQAGPLGGRDITDDVRRLYLNDYRDVWKAFIADVKLQPLQSISSAIEKTRFLSGPDSPLLPMLKTFSRHTTLLAPAPGAAAAASDRIGELLRKGQKAVRDAVGVRASTSGAPGERLESIVDDEFRGLRAMVTAPEGGRAPIEGLVARLQELQVLLTGMDAALKAKSTPPASPLPNQLKVEGSNAPEPVRSLLDQLGTASARAAGLQLRSTLSERVRSEIGEFCNQAINGRYPFDPSSAVDVTPADFSQLFGPGGRFERVFNELLPYVDTSARPWRFRDVEGSPLGSDLGSLPQFQRAQAIREAFFPAGGAQPGLRLMMKPLEMDTRLREFVMDVDGQQLRYDHGPQIAVDVRWPGPKGTGQVTVQVSPASSAGMRREGAWALLRVFESAVITPGPSPERFKASFNFDGRVTVFDVTNSSVRSPFQLPELKQFRCPNGL